MDGRKATGGKLEVRVKIREPLSGVDLQPVTEKWLVLDPVSPISPPERQKERVSRVLISPDLNVCRLWKVTEAEQTHYLRCILQYFVTFRNQRSDKV